MTKKTQTTTTRLIAAIALVTALATTGGFAAHQIDQRPSADTIPRCC